MAKLTLTIYGVIINRMPLQKTDVSISVGDDVINGELSKRMPLLQRDLSSKDAKWEKEGVMDVNFSLSLGTFQLQQKMYSPHEIEAEILITPTNIDRTTQKVNLSKVDFLDMFANKRVALTFSNRNENSEEVTYTVGEDFYVHEFIPCKQPDKVQVMLKIYSPDKLLTLSQYCRSFTAKKLGGDILKKELPNFKLPYVKDESVKCDTTQMKHLLRGKQEHIIPYLVQYNESFYDLLARTTNRNGEFMYYYDGKLRIGYDADESKAVEIIDGYKSITYHNTPLAQLKQENEGPVELEASYDDNVLKSKVKKNGAAKVTGTIKDMASLENGADRYWLKKVGQVLTNGKPLMNFMFNTAVDDLWAWAQADTLASKYNDKHNKLYFNKKKEHISMLDEQYDNGKTTLFQFSEADSIIKAKDYAKILAGELLAEHNTIEIDYDTFAPCLHLGQLIKVDDKPYIISGITAKQETVNSYKIENYTDVIVVPSKKLVFRVNAIGMNDDKKFYPMMIPAGHIRQSGPQVAVVVDADDPTKKNRVRVEYPWQFTSAKPAFDSVTASDLKDRDVTDASPWLIYAASSGPAGAGVHGKHYLAEKVLVNYVNNNIERPYVVGAVSKDTPGALRTGAAVLQSPNGQYLKVVEGNGQGATAFMTNFTPGLNLVTGFLDYPDIFGGDNEISKAFEGGVELGDKYGIWKISGSTDKRAISISSPWGNVKVSAFTGITLDAPNGDIKIRGKNVSIEAGNNLSLVSGNNIKNKFVSGYGDGYPFSMTTFLYDVGVVVAKKLAEMVDSVYDLSLIRSVLEVYWRPQEGALSVQSNRYLMLSAGGAKPGYPYSAYRDPQKRFQKDNSVSGMLKMGPIMKELLGRLPHIVYRMVNNYKWRYGLCVKKRVEFDEVFADLEKYSNGKYSNGKLEEAPCNGYQELKNKFWDPKTKELTEADLGFKVNCKCDSIADVDNEALIRYDAQIDKNNQAEVDKAKQDIINKRKSLKEDLVKKAKYLLNSIANLRSEPTKLKDIKTYGISRSFSNAPADYIKAVEAAFSEEKCKDSTFFKYAYDEKNAITDSRANLTDASLQGLDLHATALYRRAALNLVEAWGMNSTKAITKELKNGAIVDSQIAKKPAKPVSDEDLEKDNMWSLYVSSLEFEKPIKKQGSLLDEIVSDSKFDPLSKINLKVPYDEYNAWGNQKTGQILFGTGTTLCMKTDGTIGELDTSYNEGKISTVLKNDKEKRAYEELNNNIQGYLSGLRIV